MTELAASPVVGTTGTYPPAHLVIVFRRVELSIRLRGMLALGLLVASAVRRVGRKSKSKRVARSFVLTLLHEKHILCSLSIMLILLTSR